MKAYSKSVKRYVLYVFLIVVKVQLSYSQIATIKDADGWVNMRKQPNVNAEVNYKIITNQVFWYATEDTASSWVKVYVPKNTYSLDGCNESFYLSGYIHKSRLLPIDSIKEYTGTDFSFRYELAAFNADHKIIDKDEGGWIQAINGLKAYGTDGTIPKVEVIDIHIQLYGKEIAVSKALYQDIFECTNTFKIYKNKDCFIVYQMNSDGAGAYGLVWVVNTSGVAQRFIMVY